MSIPFKRLIVGRPLSSDRLGEQMLPKRIALPVFASDPLSSVAYATQEILLVLTLGGLAHLHLAPWVAAAVVVLLAMVVLSYRQVAVGGGHHRQRNQQLRVVAGPPSKQQPVWSLRDDELALSGWQDAPAGSADGDHADQHRPGGGARLQAAGLTVADPRMIWFAGPAVSKVWKPDRQDGAGCCGRARTS